MQAEIDKLIKEQGEGITTSQLEIDTSAINKWQKNTKL